MVLKQWPKYFLTSWSRNFERSRTNGRTNRHVNSMTKSAQGADLMKIELYCVHFTKLLQLYCFTNVNIKKWKVKTYFSSSIVPSLIKCVLGLFTRNLFDHWKWEFCNGTDRQTDKQTDMADSWPNWLIGSIWYKLCNLFFFFYKTYIFWRWPKIEP